jgi:hypothetical protein
MRAAALARSRHMKKQIFPAGSNAHQNVGLIVTRAILGSDNHIAGLPAVRVERLA